MAPTLYHVPRTISSPIVQILLELKIVDDPVVVKKLGFADLKSESHLAVNPMGTAPAFTDTEQDIVMWESGAVLTYLLEAYDKSFRFHPAPLCVVSDAAASKARAKFLHLQQYIIATVYPFIASLYIHTLKPQDQQDSVYVENAKQKWRTLLGPILTKWLGDGEYFMGNSTPSAIDFLVTKPLNNVNSLEMLSEFPALDKLFRRMKGLPSFDEAYDEQAKMPPQQQTQQQLVLVTGE